MAWVSVAPLIGSFLFATLATWEVRGMARSRGFVDAPGGHKQHERPVALGGGVAIFGTIALAMVGAFAVAWGGTRFGWPDGTPPLVRMHAAGILSKWPETAAILLSATALHVMGLVDDRRPLGPMVKLVVEVGLALVLATGFNIRILDLAVFPPGVSVVLTIVWIVGITNAFNFLDNMDGLSAGVAAITGSVFATAAFMSGQVFVPALMLVVVGACLGFVLFNTHPATIYMGDSGSLVIGFFMSILIALTNFYDPSRSATPAGVFLPVVVLAVPLYDVLSVCAYRYRAGDSLIRGDRRHFSHRLVRRGFSVRAAVLTIYLATAATSLAAIALPTADWPVACCVFAQCLCVVAMIAVLEHVGGPMDYQT